MTARGNRSSKKPAPVALLIACDLLLIGVALCVFALFHHVLPRAYVVVGASTNTRLTSVASAVGIEDTGAATATLLRPTSTPQASSAQVAATAPTATVTRAATATTASAGAVGAQFAAKFTTGQVIRTATTYQSANVSVTLTKKQQNGITYYIEDIYIRNIENLRTAFAQNTYGRAITDWVLDMAKENNAIAAINGDYYGTGMTGVVIRNGVLYNAKPDGDVCVLFYDGTMKVYPAAEFDAQTVIAAGAYQAWSFGPSLISTNGKALASFNSRVSGPNPRTAIGYYEPGHYVFVVVDGRQAGYSDGMTLAQLAALFEQLGCKVAYNLDGGQTSSMTFGDKLANQPFRGGRLTSDIIYIGE